ASRAEALGLVSTVVPKGEARTAAADLLGRITKHGPVALRMALESIYHGLDVATDEALAFESSLFGLLASTRDMKEGMAAFLERRKPGSSARCARSGGWRRPPERGRFQACYGAPSRPRIPGVLHGPRRGPEPPVAAPLPEPGR